MSPTGGPGGTVNVEKPKTRYDQAWRALWWAALVTVPNDVHKTRQAINGARAAIGSRRR